MNESYERQHQSRIANVVIQDYDNRPTAATELARKLEIKRQETKRIAARRERWARTAAYFLIFVVLPGAIIFAKYYWTQHGQ